MACLCSNCLGGVFLSFTSLNASKSICKQNVPKVYIIYIMRRYMLMEIDGKEFGNAI